MNAVLGVGGGIAAYKSAELARALMERGFRVQVVMTRAAQNFIQPLTFAALTGRKVITDLFSAGSAEDTLSSAVEHIAVAQDNDVLVVAPATADLLAKFAHGQADDFLTTLYLAFQRPVVLAPAMNTNMWNHAATRENMSILRRRAHVVVEPESGMLACGTVGPGRLAEPETIAAVIAGLMLRQRDLEGETVLISAGPTREPIDPVRFITNHSSGKMGYALAGAALERGARVILIAGPVNLSDPTGATVIHVTTAREMRAAVMSHLREAGIVIKAAAVADYRVASEASRKIKKTGDRVTLELEQNPDILAEVGAVKDGRFLVGFAAETENLIPEARRKLEAKNCDMIVANIVGREGTGFDSDENEVVLVPKSGEPIPLSRASKHEIARCILDQIQKVRRAAHAIR